ncbi:MAG: hypothetical protein MN733_01500 [Nitrososphaera sp.]|nr:hypothetical protein [Nitrososphaera sp.]
MSLTFEVIDYDVWGNEDDGYYVNDVFSTGSTITLNECEFESDVLLAKALAREVTWRDASELELDGDEYTIFVDELSTGKPLFELRLVERDFERIDS